MAIPFHSTVAIRKFYRQVLLYYGCDACISNERHDFVPVSVGKDGIDLSSELSSEVI